MSKLKLIAVALCTVMALSAQAFKPDSDTYGHKMITQGILSDKDGYSFGVKIPGFRPSFVDGGTAAVGADAKTWITRGAMSRDEIGVEGLLCVVDDQPVFAPESVKLQSWKFWNVTTYLGKQFCYSADLYDGDGHFDNDNILGSTRAIRDHVLEAVSLLTMYQTAVDDGTLESTSPKISVAHLAGARMMLGKALHTLQDFYAHSNWADTHSASSADVQPEIFTPISNYLTNKMNPWDGHAFAAVEPVKYYAWRNVGESFNKLTTELVVTGAHVPEPDLTYPSSSSVVSNQTCLPNEFSKFNPGDDASSWSGEGFNDGNWQLSGDFALRPNYITTGAFWTGKSSHGGNGVAAAQDNSIAGRCDHGIAGVHWGLDAFDRSRVMGIAKDAPWYPLAGHGPQDGVHQGWETEDEAKAAYASYTKADVAARVSTDLHKRASDAAALHTKELLNIFVQKVKDTDPFKLGKADRMLASFFDTDGLTPFKGFVIDRSATMYDVLPTLVAEIKSQLGTDPYPRVAVISFADVDDIGKVAIGDEVRSALDAMVAKGGNGCLTPVHLATKRLFEKLQEKKLSGASVTYFTDAGALVSVTDPKDGKPVTLKTITDLASQTKSTVKPVVSGACSPLDPSHIGIAAQTNAPLLVVEQSAAGMAAGVAGAFDGGDDPRAVYVENASITSGKTISFPVETGASKLKISLAHNLGSYSIRQPDGVALTPPSPGGFSPVMNADAVTVDSPQPGDWQVDLMPGGAPMDYALQATVNNSIEFHDIEFVSVVEVGRPGHEYSPRHGKVGQTGQSRALVHMVGAVSNLRLQALGFDGAVLGDWSLTDRDGTHFDALVSLPSVEYRPRVAGVDATGKAFSRMLATALPPAVAAPKGAFDLQAIVPAWQEGGANAFGVLITNLGGDDTVTLSASSSGGFAVSMTDSSLLVPGSSRAKAMGSLTLPIRAVGSTVDIAVRSSGGTEKTLSIQVPSFVVVPSAPGSVTASAGNAQATVTFTAPADNGGAAIAGYTVTSTPGNFIASGTASPITVTGLANGTSYRFTVRASNTAGAGVDSAASNSVIPAVPQVALGITLTGTGAGSVGSSPAGVACGANCTSTFDPGAIVTLSATPDAGSTFAGWSGYAGCASANQCTFTMPAEPVSLVATFAPISIDKGLMAYYCFDDPTNLGKDCGTNGNDGIASGGVSAESGVIGRGALFGGLTTPGVIRVPNSASLQFGTAATVSFFVKVDNAAGMDSYGNPAPRGTFAVIAKRHDTAGLTWNVGVDATDHLWSTFGGYSGVTVVADSVQLKGWASGGTGRWVHVVHVLDSVGPKIYMDGQMVWSAAATVDFAVTNAQDLYIGKFSDSWYPLNGSLDEVRIFNRALSTDEVQVLYSAASAYSADLSVTAIGSGEGSVTSGETPAHINCLSAVGGSTGVCRSHEANMAAVTLTAQVAEGSTFAGWSGVCTGTSNTCSLTMDAAKSVTATFTKNTTAPDAPTGISAVAGSASAAVTFAAPASSGGSAITGYTVTSTPAGGVDSNAGSTALTHTITGLVNGTAYTFIVMATNSAGQSLPSASSNSVTPLGVQVVTFGASPTVVVGGTGTVNATGGTSGNAVIFTSSTTGVCTVSGTNGSTVAGVAAGTCIIAANQAGSAAYAAAAQVTQSITIGQGSGQSLSFAPGWNLLGNSLNQALSVVPTFADTAIVTSVWKWDTLTAGWQFYTPVLTSGALQTYATSKGYGVLSVINPGEGYWVNAKVAGSVVTPAGTTFALASGNLVSGWNLVATGIDATPREFNLSLSATPPAPGVTPINLTSLWAWDNPLSAWYFYAPVLEANGGLVNYITSKGYLDFTQSAKKLGNGIGFWVNRP